MVACPLLTEHPKLLTSEPTDTPDPPCVCCKPVSTDSHLAKESSRKRLLGEQQVLSGWAVSEKQSGFSKYMVFQKNSCVYLERVGI